MEWAAQLYTFTAILAITGWVAFTLSVFGYEKRLKRLESTVSRLTRKKNAIRETGEGVR